MPAKRLGLVEKVQMLISFENTGNPVLLTKLDKKYHDPDVLSQLAMSYLVRVGHLMTDEEDAEFKPFIRESVKRKVGGELDEEDTLDKDSRLAVCLSRRGVIDRNELASIDPQLEKRHCQILKAMLRLEEKYDREKRITRRLVMCEVLDKKVDSDQANKSWRYFSSLSDWGYLDTKEAKANGCRLTEIGRAKAKALSV